MIPKPSSTNWRNGKFHGVAYAVAVVAVAALYFVVAKSSLALASINPSATPVWPPTGLAIAALVLAGYRMWPAVLCGAFLVNLVTAGSVYTSVAIGFGNMLEALSAAWLINRWSGGAATFSTPANVARFAALTFFPSTTVSATVGVGSLLLGGYAAPRDAGAIWLTWWMGDLGGALLITPLILLITAPSPAWRATSAARSIAVFAAAAVVGTIAFSPLAALIPNSGPLAFLAVAPLMWSAVYQNQRDTAITAFIIACFAIWGAAANAGPFVQSTRNDSFLLLLAFMISISVPSLALSANSAAQAERERHIESLMLELSHRTKNVLMVIQSVARQIARRVDSLDAFDDAFSDRVATLAQTHNLLAKRDWRGAALRDVIGSQLEAFVANDDTRVTLTGPAVVIAPRAVEQIGLAVHELATNAAKHGALFTEAGRVAAQWELKPDGAGELQLVVSWSESGGLVTPPERNGFGYVVLTDFVPRSLNGEAHLEFRPDSVRWTLRAPAKVVLAPSELTANAERRMA